MVKQVLSAAVIGYQATIIASLLAARLFGTMVNKPDAVFWVAMAWTVFTFAFVFTTPLFALQLIVIWGIFAWIRPKGQDTEPSIDLHRASLADKRHTPHSSGGCLEEFKEKLDTSLEMATKRADEQDRRIQQELDSDPELRRMYDEVRAKWDNV